MSIILPDLPYSESALSPCISEETIGFHYHKHHSGYVTRLNELIKGSELENASLEQIILAEKKGTVFNNAAQIWNHTFYWESMSPSGGGDPDGKMLEMLNASFGSADEFRAEFLKMALSVFGSGWVWLVEAPKQGLEILTTQNADLPLLKGKKALLTLDVWEHAYYLDYQNLRADYVKRWLEELVNWDFALACSEAPIQE